MYALYIIIHLIVATVAPLFFAVLLPLSTVTSLLFVGKWSNIKKSLQHPLFLVSIFVIALLFLSASYSTFPYQSLKDTAQFSALLLCFALLWGLKTSVENTLGEQEKKFILVFFAISLLVILGLTLLIKQGWLDWNDYSLNRQLATLTLFFWPLSLYFKEKKYQLAVLSLYALLWICIILGHSETALIMMILSSFTYVIFRFLPGSIGLRTGLFVVGISLILLVPSVIVYFIPASQIEPLLGSKLHHYNIWVSTMHDAIHYFPKGTGLNTTQLLNTSQAIAERGFSRHHPHNLSLELIIELGVLGLFLIALIIGGASVLFYKTKSASQPIVAATFVAMFVLYTLAFSVWQDWRNGLVAFALIVLQRFLSEQPDTNRQ